MEKIKAIFEELSYSSQHSCSWTHFLFVMMEEVSILLLIDNFSTFVLGPILFYFLKDFLFQLSSHLFFLDHLYQCTNIVHIKK